MWTITNAADEDEKHEKTKENPKIYTILVVATMDCEVFDVAENLSSGVGSDGNIFAVAAATDDILNVATTVVVVVVVSHMDVG